MLKLQLKHFFSVLILGFILPRSSFAFVYFTDFSVYHLFYCKPTSVGIIKHLSSLIHLSIHASFTVSPLLFFSIFLVLFCHKSILCAPPPHYPDLHSPNFNAPSLLVVLCIYLILLSKPLSYTSPVLLGHALKGITFSPHLQPPHPQSLLNRSAAPPLVGHTGFQENALPRQFWDALNHVFEWHDSF